MKFLKKINTGLILTIIVVLALVVYLVEVERQREDDKTEIRSACEEFIDVTDKYLVLPEEMQTLTGEVSEEAEKAYEQEAEEALKDIMVDNSEAVKIQHQFLVQALKRGYTDINEVRTKYERNITKIASYEFEGNTVTVTFSSKVETEAKYLNYLNQEQTRVQSFSPSNDEIMLQKIDGQWKVTYANLQYDVYGNSISLDVY